MGSPLQRPPLFRGTYKSKKIVRVAPDAFVKINGAVDLAQCSKCERSFDINPYVNSISIDLNINSTPGSAVINMSIPRHDINNFYGDGHFLITEMMEVEIFMKGYFNVYGVPQYYPVFWGLVTRVDEDYSSGEHTVSLSCADILKWWEKTRLNVNPSWFDAGFTKAGSIALLGNVFAGSNPYDVIFSLARDVSGDLMFGIRTLRSSDLDIKQQKGKLAVASLKSYWNKRFSRIKKSLVLYGMNGVGIRPSELLYEEAERLEKQIASTKKGKLRNNLSKRYKKLASDALHKIVDPETGRKFLDPTSPNIVAWKNMFTQAGQVDLWESEYMSKLEVANKTKQVINFEFYMDSTGDIVFKPPFWNLNVKGNRPISWIRDIDVIDWNFSSSESEVTNVLTMTGSFSSRSAFGTPGVVNPSSTVVDYDLVAKYGVRAQDYQSEWITSSKGLFFHGLDVLDHVNSNRTTGSITIPLRPELRMGFPVYIESRDEFWYVQGVSHSITFGGRASTTLSLVQKRGKFIAPKDFATSVPELKQAEKVTTADALNGTSAVPRDPKTGKIEGHKNIVMVYNQTIGDLSQDQVNNLLSKSKEGKAERRGARKGRSQSEKQKSNTLALKNLRDTSPADMEKEDALEFLHSWGNPGLGHYIYAQADGMNIKRAGAVNIDLALNGRDTSGKVRKQPSASDLKRNKDARFVFPVSDEEGYDHVGNYAYGRGLTLSGGGIREPSGGVSLGLTDNTDYSHVSSVIKSQGLENFLTMAPQSHTDSDVGKATEDAHPGEQEVGSYSVGDPMNIQVDSVSRGLTLSNMSPISANDQMCTCTMSRMNLDLLALVSNKTGTGDPTIERSEINTKSGLSTRLKDVFSIDSTTLSEHMDYEKKIREK